MSFCWMFGVVAVVRFHLGPVYAQNETCSDVCSNYLHVPFVLLFLDRAKEVTHFMI